jgi:hypothetical protein
MSLQRENNIDIRLMNARHILCKAWTIYFGYIILFCLLTSLIR